MKKMLSGRSALSLAGLTVLSALLFLICTCERTNPFDSHNPNYIPPSITIDSTGVNVIDGDSLTTDAATITVTGNRTESLFRARIDSAVWSPWGAAGVFGYDSLTSGRHVVSIESKYEGGDFVVTDTIAFFVRSGINSVKALTAFSFANPAVTGTINETAKTVALTVPFGTNVTALAATFSTTGSSVKVGSVVQVSGTTANNFTSSIIYTVTAGDNSTQDYVVTVTISLNTAKALTAFSFTNPAVTGTINETAKTVAVTVPFGTNATALAATFSTTGSSVKVGSVVQTSGTTPNNFTTPIIYTITAGDSSTQDYTVTVTISLNTAKALTAFSFANPAVTGTINETAKTVALTVPLGTNITALVATFSTTGSSVKLSGVSQVSGVTANNFTNAIAYTVTAGDNSTQDYVVTVTISLNTAKALTAFSFANPAVTATINETAKTVAVTVPFGTNVTALAATFSTTGSSVKVGSVVQVSGTTTNDFASQVTYTVTAGDNSTQDYKVTVIISLNTAKALTAFRFTNLSDPGIINDTNKTVRVTVPYGTDVRTLAAIFSTTGASVKVGSAVQVSGQTTINFTNSVTYTITAADGSTQDYIVTVTIAPYVFTVTFDGQSATTPPSPLTKTVIAPATTVVTLPTDPQKLNYKFDGWFTGTSGSGTAFVGSTPVTGTFTVYAKWTRVYTVIYNANFANISTGTGTVPVDTNKYPNSSTVSVLDSNTLSQAYYAFKGWNTKPDASGENYLFNTKFAMGNGDMTLYANWRMNAPTISPIANQSCPVNDTATFTVVATGVGLHYQWTRNNDIIINANASSYTPPALTVNDTVVALTYRCVVSNLGGSITSNAATLSISTLTDADNNVYHQVKIGTQVWTMENLRVTKYRDGTLITKDTSKANWGTIFSSSDSGKYCWFNNDATYKNSYGALYNWYVVDTAKTKKIAPLGWHVPTASEWTTLSTYLGGESVAGDQMKEAGPAHWPAPNTDASNTSGFLALPGGYRNHDGTFYYIGSYGYWWSATTAATDASFAYGRYLIYSYHDLFGSVYVKSRGFSLRLVRD